MNCPNFDLPEHIKAHFGDDDFLAYILLLDENERTQLCLYTEEQWNEVVEESRENGLGIPPVVYWQGKKWIIKNKQTINDQADFFCFKLGREGVKLTEEEVWESIRFGVYLGFSVVGYSSITSKYKCWNSLDLNDPKWRIISLYSLAIIISSICSDRFGSLEFEDVKKLYRHRDMSLIAHFQFLFGKINFPFFAEYNVFNDSNHINIHPNLLFVWIGIAFGAASENHKPIKEWWKAVYRVLHDRGFIRASCREDFVLYMIEHGDMLYYIGKLLNINEYLIDPAYWHSTQGKDEDKNGLIKPDVNNSPLQISGNGKEFAYYIKNQWPWMIEGMKDYYHCKLNLKWSTKELKAQFNSSDSFDAMYEIAEILDSIFQTFLGNPYTK